MIKRIKRIVEGRGKGLGKNLSDLYSHLVSFIPSIALYISQFIAGAIGWILAFLLCKYILKVDDFYIALMIFLPFIFIPFMLIKKLFKKKNWFPEKNIVRKTIKENLSIIEQLKFTIRLFITERKNKEKISQDLMSLLERKGVNLHELKKKIPGNIQRE